MVIEILVYSSVSIHDNSLLNITLLFDVLPIWITIDEIKKFKTPKGEIDTFNNLFVYVNKQSLRDAKSITMGTPSPMIEHHWIYNFCLLRLLQLSTRNSLFSIVDTRFVCNLRKLFMETILKAAKERQEHV